MRRVAKNERFDIRIGTEIDYLHDEVREETGFWGRAGAGCIVMAASTGRILLSLRGPKVLESDTWGNYGGAIDPGEDVIEAALRELVQETSTHVPTDRVVPLYVFEDRRTGFRYSNFVVVVDDEFEPLVDGNETAGFVWASLDALPEPLHFGMEALFSDEESLVALRSIANGSHPVLEATAFRR